MARIKKTVRITFSEKEYEIITQYAENQNISFQKSMNHFIKFDDSILKKINDKKCSTFRNG